MSDTRVAEYARLLVEWCVGVQPGWQVIIRTNPLARPVIEETMRLIAGRGAYALLRLSYGAPHMNLAAVDAAWAVAAPDELLVQMPPIERHALENADALILIEAPDGREAEAVSGLIARRHLLRQSVRPLMQRLAGGAFPTTYGMFPTDALAQEAGMSLIEYEDLLYSACLLPWDREQVRMRDIARRLDGAEEVRITGSGTDLTLSLRDRQAGVEDGRENLPGGRVYYAPAEASARGVIQFDEFPVVYRRRTVEGARLVLEDGAIAEAAAREGEAFLAETLATGTRAWTLQELGIGCNPAVGWFTRQLLFDQKIDGTVHLVFNGNSPTSAPWTMVKDLRRGGQIYNDGELLYDSGAWV